MPDRTLYKVFIFGEIDEKMKQKINLQLANIALVANKNDVLVVIINSMGGYRKPALDIIENITALNLPILTVGYDFVGSAATLLLACGQYRVLTRGTPVVHHKGKLKLTIEEKLYEHTELIDLAMRLLKMAKKTAKEHDHFYDLATRGSHINGHDLQKLILQAKGEDLYFPNQDAKKLGLVHDVIPSLRHVRSYIAKKIK